MQVILHIGAHLRATMKFRHYMGNNMEKLAQDAIAFWGPMRTRKGLFAGIVTPLPGIQQTKAFRRGAGHVQVNLDRVKASGMTELVVSDENMIGTVRENLRLGFLYPVIGHRMARYHVAFGGRVTDIVLNICTQHSYWTSALVYRVARGHGVPEHRVLDRLVGSARGWRNVVTDLVCAVPDARIWVLPFESYAGLPGAHFEHMMGRPAPTTDARDRKNATPPLETLRANLPGDLRARVCRSAKSAGGGSKMTKKRLLVCATTKISTGSPAGQTGWPGWPAALGP